MKIGQQVTILRKRLGLTQKEFAAALTPKTDYTYIDKIERNDQYPSIKMLQRMGRAFNKPLSYWFEDKSEFYPLAFLVSKKATKMRALACLFSKYCWEEGRFSTCPITCEIQDNLCGAVKALITE